jgi:hypothetical protein
MPGLYYLYRRSKTDFFFKSCQKVVKRLSKKCQKVVQKFVKSCQKVAKKLSKKLSKSCQKLSKVAKKLLTLSHLVKTGLCMATLNKAKQFSATKVKLNITKQYMYGKSEHNKRIYRVSQKTLNGFARLYISQESSGR